MKKPVGVWNYTVILTYLSLGCAVAGIFLSAAGHVYAACFLLLGSGLCDAFDGRVARSKKDRTELEKGFGIQIDSLTDVVAFGVLPAAMGSALLGSSEALAERPALLILSFVLLGLFVLAGLIRLAYFNVTEEELQQSGEGHRKFYLGFPITTSCLYFPTFLLIRYLAGFDGAVLYAVLAFVLGALFIAPVKVPKPGLKGILCLVLLAAAELLVLILFSVF